MNEKQIERLEKDISEIKSNVKRIRTELNIIGVLLVFGIFIGLNKIYHTVDRIDKNVKEISNPVKSVKEFFK